MKMAGRKSLMHPRLEELGALSPVASPLRRRSSIGGIAGPSGAGNVGGSPGISGTPSVHGMPSNIENDDETERALRRQEKNPPPAGESDRRRSLGVSFVSKMSNPQIVNAVSQCIKMSAENKINARNAFSLEMIDFMTFMIKKRDGNMSNLQMASTSLDVSTKIYGFRVDGVHSDILKISGGLEKPEKQDGRRESEGGVENVDAGDAEAEGEQTQRAKKKKKSKTKILATEESLRCTIETVNPTSMMVGEMDSQTTDMLYQAILPMHANSDLYLHPYIDVILDVVHPDRELNVNTNLVNCPRLERFDDLHLCPPFANFDFLGWSPEEELNLTPESQPASQPVDEGFQFDLDASLPADDEPAATMNYFDMDDDEENVARHHRAGPPPANVVDFREVVQTASKNRNFEYSYVLENMNIRNAGASHWKIRFPSKNLEGSKEFKAGGREQSKRRNDADLLFENGEEFEQCMAKFDIGKNSVKLQNKTAKVGWTEENSTRPKAVKFDETKCCHYWLRPDVIKKFPEKNQMNATQLPDDEYDYNNEHDTTDYCPNVEPDDHQTDNEQIVNNGVDADVGTEPEDYNNIGTQPFTGDNLVEAPRMTNKIYLPFSQRAKKIDMRALKKAIWKDLTVAVGDKENINTDVNVEKINGAKNFSDVYNNLPNRLAKSNAEALSAPIAFISLLHIANEKSLQIDSLEDFSDLIIRQG